MIKARILDRYIFREILTPFFLSMAALTLVLLIQKMFKFAELVIAKGASFTAAVKLLAYIMPSFLIITIPMSLLVATLTAFTRLSTDSEITAMKASRVSLYSMLRPVLVFAFLTSLATGITSIFLLPGANHALKVHLFNMVKSKAMVGIEPGVFTSTFDGMVIYVDKMESLDEMEGIFISDERSADSPIAITAKWGRLIADTKSFIVTLAMEEGEVHATPGEERPYTLTRFNAGRLYLDIHHALIAKGPQQKGFKETGTLELMRRLRRSDTEKRDAIPIASEIHKRLAVPVACLIFGMVGAPLGMRRSRSGKSAGIALALVVFLVYYVLLGTGKNLAEAGTIPPAAAYWIPNALAASAAALLVFKKGHEYEFGITKRIDHLYRRFTEKKKLR